MASTIARPVTPPDFAESRDQSSFPLSPSTARYSTGMKSSPRRRPPPSFPNSPRRREHYHQHSVSMHGDLATARAAHDWHHSQMARPGEPRRDSPPEDSHGVLQTPHMLRVPPTPETACPIPTPTMRPRRSSELVSLGDQDRQSSIGPSRSVGASSAGLGIVVGAATGSTAPRGQRPTASGATANATSPYRKRMALPSVEGRQAQASSTTSKPVRNRAGPVSRTRLLESLRDLAPQYWSMGNGDVTVLVPFDHRAAPPCHATTSASGRQQDGRSTPAQGKMVHCYAAVPTRASGAESKCQPPPTPTSASSRASQATEQSNGALDSKDWHDDARDPERTPRRASMQFEPATPVRLPQLVAYPVMKFSMHRDFLIAQSSGLRDLLVRSRPQMSAAAGGPPPAPRPTATLRGARMLSSPQTVTPVLWLPVPDSKSFPTLVHWMYWGDANAIESALSSGEVSWQGMVKNIEYLGLDNEIRRVVRAWWRRWVKVGEAAGAGRRSDANNAAQVSQESEDEAPQGDSRSTSPEPRDSREATMDIDDGVKKGSTEANRIAQMLSTL